MVLTISIISNKNNKNISNNIFSQIVLCLLYFILEQYYIRVIIIICLPTIIILHYVILYDNVNKMPNIQPFFFNMYLVILSKCYSSLEADPS